jgi:hypothetical protein
VVVVVEVVPAEVEPGVAAPAAGTTGATGTALYR